MGILLPAALNLRTTQLKDTSSELASGNTLKDFTCNQCGITFDNVDDKEEHIKLEHDEHKLPTGCA